MSPAVPTLRPAVRENHKGSVSGHSKFQPDTITLHHNKVEIVHDTPAPLFEYRHRDLPVDIAILSKHNNLTYAYCNQPKR